MGQAVPVTGADAVTAIRAVLGESGGTQKMAKWEHRGGLTVNVHRESVRFASVWIAGLDSKHDLPDFATEAPYTDGVRSKKNGNHSSEIENGPHVFFRIRESDELDLKPACFHRWAH